ncbi:hypothetical protein KIN34_14325 [Cellulomonas sp. DKR-3]|uniref:Uncharacterized protein n=1 Tax=Cellulomonas fulva TaxID=2835530 RepID=A0ABS5U244_9CELL|nr:hypothetical protein [Cellulomonas fulva]MBT0995460.1 hypothetical protein [Cellulomonas fulva]
MGKSEFDQAAEVFLKRVSGLQPTNDEVLRLLFGLLEYERASEFINDLNDRLDTAFWEARSGTGAK